MAYMKEHGSRLGGKTSQYFLRSIGKDGFILSTDVVMALQHFGLDIADMPTSKRDMNKIQELFNKWHDETGLSYTHLSKISSYSIGKNCDAEIIKVEMAK